MMISGGKNLLSCDLMSAVSDIGESSRELSLAFTVSLTVRPSAFFTGERRLHSFHNLAHVFH